MNYSDGKPSNPEDPPPTCRKVAHDRQRTGGKRSYAEQLSYQVTIQRFDHVTTSRLASERSQSRDIS